MMDMYVTLKHRKSSDELRDCMGSVSIRQLGKEVQGDYSRRGTVGKNCGSRGNRNAI